MIFIIIKKGTYEFRLPLRKKTDHSAGNLGRIMQQLLVNICYGAITVCCIGVTVVLVVNMRFPWHEITVAYIFAIHPLVWKVKVDVQADLKSVVT